MEAKYYYDSLLPLVKADRIALPNIPAAYVYNAHMFYIKLRDIEDRTSFIDSPKTVGIISVFHYILLHARYTSEQFGRFAGEDRYTSQESARLVRLPQFYTLYDADQYRVINSVLGFFTRYVVGKIISLDSWLHIDQNRCRAIGGETTGGGIWPWRCRASRQLPSVDYRTGRTVRCRDF